MHDASRQLPAHSAPDAAFSSYNALRIFVVIQLEIEGRQCCFLCAGYFSSAVSLPEVGGAAKERSSTDREIWGKAGAVPPMLLRLPSDWAWPAHFFPFAEAFLLRATQTTGVLAISQDSPPGGRHFQCSAHHDFGAGQDLAQARTILFFRAGYQRAKELSHATKPARIVIFTPQFRPRAAVTTFLHYASTLDARAKQLLAQHDGYQVGDAQRMPRSFPFDITKCNT